MTGRNHGPGRDPRTPRIWWPLLGDALKLDHPLLAAAVDNLLRLIGRVMGALGDHALQRGDQATVPRVVMAVERLRPTSAAHRLVAGRQPASGSRP